MEFNPAFGKRIRELRQREGGMSLRELARRTGISPSYLSQIEQGKLPPPMGNIVIILALSRELNEDPEALAKLTARPTHSLAELLSDHPEVIEYLAESFLELDEEHIKPGIVGLILGQIIQDNYGKFLRKMKPGDIEPVIERMLKIRREMLKGDEGQ